MSGRLSLAVSCCVCFSGYAQKDGDSAKYTDSSTHDGEAGKDQDDYTNKYASAYKKYMSAADQGKDDYTNKYASAYKKYVSQGQGGVAEGGAEGGDDHKSAEKYAGDYQKLMSQGQGGGAQGGAKGGKYVDQYAGDYKKYMGQGQGGGAQGGDADKKHEEAKNGKVAEKKGSPRPVSLKNLAAVPSSSQYAASGGAPASAESCKTEDELKAWMDSVTKHIEQYVPKPFQQYPLKQLQKQYDDNLKRIQAEEDAASIVAPEEEDDTESELTQSLSATAPVDVADAADAADATDATDATDAADAVDAADTTDATDAADAADAADVEQGTQLAGKRSPSIGSTTPFMLLGLVSAGALAFFLPSFTRQGTPEAYLKLEEPCEEP